MGSEFIDLSLKNIWKSWFAFRKGKRATFELHGFQYCLEKNLYELYRDLNSRCYRHGGYRKFVVCDNKRREISVASVRDRIIHRLIYDYLENLYDKTFIYDAWSCRKGKGLLGAIERTQHFLKCHVSCATHTRESHFSYVWKCDIRKFFDSVDQEILLKILSRRIKNSTTFSLLKEVIYTFKIAPPPKRGIPPGHRPRLGGGRNAGIPIGNLTSQIFANIYLNELDRFMKHILKAKSYLRYGDDFIVVESNLEKLKDIRSKTARFLADKLKLQINPKSDRIMKVSDGLKFLGVTLWPSGRTLNKRNLVRVQERLRPNNISSYSGLLKKHGNIKKFKEFNWLVCEKILNQ